MTGICEIFNFPSFSRLFVCARYLCTCGKLLGTQGASKAPRTSYNEATERSLITELTCVCGPMSCSGDAKEGFALNKLRCTCKNVAVQYTLCYTILIIAASYKLQWPANALFRIPSTYRPISPLLSRCRTPPLRQSRQLLPPPKGPGFQSPLASLIQAKRP